jgi:hypothetical protein
MQTIDTRTHYLACLEAGRVCCETMRAVAEHHEAAAPAAWFASRVLLDMAHLFNGVYQHLPPISADDDLMPLIELRCEMQRYFTPWELEGKAEDDFE